jgi:hypothetical protein
LSKFAVIFAVALGLAIVSTAFAGVQLTSSPNPTVQSSLTTTSTTASNGSALTEAGGVTFGFGASSSYNLPSGNSGHPSSVLGVVVQFFQDRSLALAPGGWIFVGGLWIWRGRMKSRWEALGFDSEVFELFVRMRGGKTRVKLLNSLLIPKDRFQLAQELGLDWKAVDRHIMMLDKFGFVREQTAYGRVRIYELTSSGKMLLQLFQSLNDEESAENIVRVAELHHSEA